MALADDFNAYTDGQPLSTESADWDVHVASGTGVMTLDQHDDHSDLTLVVDMSSTGDNFAIYQTQVGSDDHFAEVDVFLDSFDEAQTSLSAQSGPVVRGNQSSMGSGTFDGYAAFLERDVNGINTAQVFLRIYRIDDDVPTLLASSADVAGQTYDASTTTATVRLEISGDSLTAYSDGNELVSTTDATYSTGQFCGVRQNRILGAADAQPFFDNFAGDTLGGGAQAITPAAQTVGATPGTLSLSIDVTPDAVTIDATPGALAMSIGIEPAAVTIEATPGTVTVTTDALQIVPDPVTVTASPGTLTITTGAVDITPDTLTIDITPGTLDLAVDVPLTGPTVNATAGALTVAVGAAGIVPDAVTIGVTPGVLVIAGGDTSDPNPFTFTHQETAGFIYQETSAFTYQEPPA